MPNLVLVSNAKFRPFSFDEMLKPALMATQAHQAVEEAYSELDTQANAIGSLASETDDPKAYAMYKAYENSLRAQAEDLAANGLNAASRQAMLNMRSRYAKEITPIQNAIERRRKLADAQMEAYMKNPTLMFQRNFNTKSWETSLDRFLEDPDYGYGDMASGALITQQAATQAGALAKKLNSIGKGKLDNYTSTFIQHYGLSPADIAAFNADPKDPKANKVLRAIYDNVYNTVPESIRNQYADDVNSYIGMGLYSAIGEDKMGTYENFGARQALQHAYRKAEIDYQNNLNNLKGGFPLNPTPIISSRSSKEVANMMDRFNKFFYKDSNGRLKMNQAGLKEYLRNPRTEALNSTRGNSKDAAIAMRGAGAASTTTEFRQLIDRLGGGKYIAKGKDGIYRMQPGNLGNLWANYYESGKSGKGMQRTEYIVDIRPEDQAGYKQQVLRAARAEKKLYGVDMDDKTDKFTNTHDDLSLEDLVSDDYTVTSQANSRYGRTLFVTNNKTGEVKRYAAPRGINYTAENSSDAALYNMSYIENALQKGVVNGKPITDAQKAFLENQYQYYKDQFGMINSQVGINYGVPTQSGTPQVW